MLSSWDMTMEMAYEGLEPVDELGYATMGKAYYKAGRGYFDAARDGRKKDALRYGRIASRAHHSILRKAANHGHVKMASDAGRFASKLGHAPKAAITAGAMALGGMAWRGIKNRYGNYDTNNTRDDVPDVETEQPRPDYHQQGHIDHSAYTTGY